MSLARGAKRKFLRESGTFMIADTRVLWFIWRLSPFGISIYYMNLLSYSPMQVLRVQNGACIEGHNTSEKRESRNLLSRLQGSLSTFAKNWT